MKLNQHYFVWIVVMASFSMSALAQLTIDATGPHQDVKKASGGSCGGVGRKLQVRVAVEVHGGPGSQKGKSVVEFVLTNSGREQLRIPISPDPDRLEPAAGNYSLRWLSLYLTSCTSPSAFPCAVAREAVILPGGAQLYGSEESATLVTLAPGESIRVRAEVALPPEFGADQKKTAIYVGHAMLNDETVTTVRGKTFRNCTQDLGSAHSPEYTPQALFKTSD